MRASYADELRKILMVTRTARFAEDSQPLARLNVFLHCEDRAAVRAWHFGWRRTRGAGLLSSERRLRNISRKEAARQAIMQLDAIEAPAGEMEVVLGPGWPGVLLHEAVGHGLEADFNRKKTSAFCRADRATRGQREVHGRRQWHDAVAARLAERG